MRTLVLQRNGLVLLALVAAGAVACAPDASPDGVEVAALGATAAAACPPTVAPTLTAPSGGLDIADDPPTFSWSAVDGAESYVLDLFFGDDNSIYVLPNEPFQVDGTDFTPDTTLPAHTLMRWKVKPECSEKYGPFSPSAYFTIGDCNTPPTSPPVIVSAPSGLITTARPTWRWRHVNLGASYTLYVLRVSDKAVLLRQTDIVGSGFTPTVDLPAGVPLRWKLKASNPCGEGPYAASSVPFKIQ
jgi:hypothetical protein